METDEQCALKLKEKGNVAFKEKRFLSAINSYTRSLELRADPIVFSNRAQAHLKVNYYTLAQMDCTAAITLDPTIPKVFYRRAEAFKNMGLLELALKDMEKCVELSKGDQQMVVLRDQLKGKKNVPMVEMGPVERDTYLESEEVFSNIPISYDESVFDEPPKKVQIVSRPEKKVPFVPRDFQDFAAAIAFLNREPLLLAEYFIKIEPNMYRQLFDELLDDTSAALVFGALLTHLKAGRQIDNLADRLLKIGELHRFDVIMMLMSNEDRQNLMAICDFLSAEDCMVVKLKYSL